MLTITSTDFQRNFGAYQDEALQQPVVITKDNRERVVLLSAKEFQRLKKRDRHVLSVFDLDESTIQLLKSSQPPESARQYDHEI